MRVAPGEPLTAEEALGRRLQRVWDCVSAKCGAHTNVPGSCQSLAAYDWLEFAGFFRHWSRVRDGGNFERRSGCRLREWGPGRTDWTMWPPHCGDSFYVEAVPRPRRGAIRTVGLSRRAAGMAAKVSASRNMTDGCAAVIRAAGPQMDTTIQIGPTGKKLLPLSVVNK
ncbi:hypothetical protein TPA0909_35710 [Streptomyces albus]|nr:hypothetical protein TPA0909_35710 [Streptomyces albus]